MFTVVTHHTPDLDAITAVWLIKRFLPNWQDASVAFVAAGKTLKDEVVDSDPHIMHVDTGFGILDHHQTDEPTCASKKTYEYLKTKVDKEGKWEDDALERMCDVVNFYDHFGEAKFKDATADYHTFDAVGIIDGLKFVFGDDNGKMVDFGFVLLDSIYKVMQEKVWAEDIIEHEGIHFESKWGKALGFETLNDAVLKVAQKMGFVVVVRKDPHKGYVRIKGMPGTKVDFTQAYESLKKKDPAATWFLHSSKKILLNGTIKNPDMKPTKLPLDEIIDVLKK